MPDEAASDRPTLEERYAKEEVKRTAKDVDELKAGMSEILRLLKASPSADKARSIEGDPNPGSRAIRESDRSGMLKNTISSVRYGRAAQHLQSAMTGVVSEKQDFRDSVDYGVLDLATTVDDLYKWASKVGRKGRAELAMSIVKWALIVVALTVIAFEILQPQDLTIIQDALGTERNQFILVALVVLGAAVYLTSFFWSRRSRKAQSVP